MTVIWPRADGSPTTTTGSASRAMQTGPGGCHTAVPDENGHVPLGACNSYYAYDPDFVAALAFAVIFLILMIAHIGQAVWYKKGFCLVLIMGIAWECASFFVRASGVKDQQSLTKVYIYNVFFLLAPLWYNAFAYMIVGRMVYFIVPEQSIWRIKAISLAKYFVWLDIVAFLVQLCGGSLLSGNSDADTIELGKTIYMSGIGFQEAFVVLFTGYTIRFHLRALELEVEGSISPEIKWRRLLYVTYVVLALITIRICFRIAEFSGSYDSEMIRNEAYALGLDATPMALAALILALVHPGTVLRGHGSEFPPRKVLKAKKKERKMAKKEEKRMLKESRV